MHKVALVAGGTGLVGSQLLPRLLASPRYSQVRALIRRPLVDPAERLVPLLTDFGDLAMLGSALAVDDVFCCLGTTLRRAGSRAAFEDVDYRMVVDLARATFAAGARQFLVVSAAGSAERSPSFYSRVKGRMEKTVSGLGFPTVHVLRPSLLLGDRAERRPAEALAQKFMPLLSPLLQGSLSKYRAVDAQDVADAMVALAAREALGVQVHDLPLAD